MKADCFVGIRLMWSLSDAVPDIRGADYRLFLRRVADLGWHPPGRQARTLRRLHRGDRSRRRPARHRSYGPHRKHGGINHPGFKAILAAIERGNTGPRFQAASGSRRLRTATLARDNCFVSAAASAFCGVAIGRLPATKARSPTMGSSPTTSTSCPKRRCAVRSIAPRSASTSDEARQILERESVCADRRPGEERGFLALARSACQALQGVPAGPIAEISLVDREIAFDHRPA